MLESAMAAGEPVFKLLDTKIDVTSPAITKSPEGPGRIEFDHVWFAYRDFEPGKDHVGKIDHVGTGTLARPAEQSSTGSSLTMSDDVLSEPAPDWVLRDVTFAI